jgi:DNA polymerase I
MTILVLDVESTILNKGNPLDRRNKLCLLGYSLLRPGSAPEDDVLDFEYTSKPYEEEAEYVRELVTEADLVVGFNIKFDLHYVQRYTGAVPKKIWDTQYAEYLLSGCTNMFPSLNDACKRFALGSKLSAVHEEFWENGIDTPDIPSDILVPYLLQDVELTRNLLFAQREEMKKYPSLIRLAAMANMDILTLMKAEHNGLHVNVQRCMEHEALCKAKIAKIDGDLYEIAGLPEGTPVSFSSPQHMGILLYGGTIEHLECPRLVEPRRGSENKRTKRKSDADLELENDMRLVEKKKPIQRIFSVGNEQLQEIAADRKTPKKAKKMIGLFLERQRLKKLVTTYYAGIPKIMEEFGWLEDGILHGQYNSCATRTGRLSSSRPNMQNMHKDIKEIFTDD